jgi:hypothetical protein
MTSQLRWNALESYLKCLCPCYSQGFCLPVKQKTEIPRLVHELEMELKAIQSSVLSLSIKTSSDRKRLQRVAQMTARNCITFMLEKEHTNSDCCYPKIAAFFQPRSDTRRKAMMPTFFAISKRLLHPHYAEFRLEASGFNHYTTSAYEKGFKSWPVALANISDEPSCLYHFLKSHPGLVGHDTSLDSASKRNKENRASKRSANQSKNGETGPTRKHLTRSRSFRRAILSSVQFPLLWRSYTEAVATN